MNRAKKAWLSMVLLVITLIINTLGALGLINGLSQKHISDMYMTLITPSPSTFSIWSVIYLLLIVSAVVMIVKKNVPYYQKAIDNISVLFWISCALNIAWIVSFSYVLIEISVLFIFGLVLVLALILQKLTEIQEKKRRLLPLSFGLYGGWLFIATVVNIAAALVKLNWDGFSLEESTWAAIILILAVLAVITVQLVNKNAVFSLPVAWAYFGIFLFLRSPEGFNSQYENLQIIAIIGMTLLIISSVIRFYKNHYCVLPVADKV